MIDIEALERMTDTQKGEITVSRKWLRALIKELKSNRETIDRLARDRNHTNAINSNLTTTEFSSSSKDPFDTPFFKEGIMSKIKGWWK